MTDLDGYSAMDSARSILLTAGDRGDTVALMTRERRVTYGELRREVVRRAERVAAGPGVVAVSNPDTVELVLDSMAVHLAGRAAVLLDSRTPAERIARVCAKTKAEPIESLGRARRDVDATSPLDMAALSSVLSTSGSTGEPKLVCRSRRADLVASMTMALGGFPIRPNTRIWQTVPIASAAMTSVCYATLLVGGTLVLEQFSPGTVNDVLAELEVDLAYFVPTMLRLVIQKTGLQGPGWSKLAGIGWGGEALDETTEAAIEAVAPGRIWAAYGATEVPVCTLASPWMRARYPGTVGRATPFHSVRVLRADGGLAERGEVGELWVTGGDAYDRYWGDEPAGRWYKTGDVGSVDGTGLVRVAGRADGLVKIGGNRVSPEESAAVLRGHAQVQQAVVIAAEDRTWGFSLHAFVVAQPGAVLDPGELDQLCRRTMPAARVPRSFTIIDEIPADRSGKTSTATLRRLLEQQGKVARD